MCRQSGVVRGDVEISFCTKQSCRPDVQLQPARGLWGLQESHDELCVGITRLSDAGVDSDMILVGCMDRPGGRSIWPAAIRRPSTIPMITLARCMFMVFPFSSCRVSELDDCIIR